jgi:hypothetical protein
MVMNIWAPIPGPGRAQFSALQMFFLCLISPLLFAQASTSDIQEADSAGDPRHNSPSRMTIFVHAT